MIIAIDESGSFVEAPSVGSWCVVAAYVFNERIRTHSFSALASLKARCGRGSSLEIKLKDIEEAEYFRFLNDLYRIGGVLFAVATDAGLNLTPGVIEHRTIQAEKIRKNVPRMKYDVGKRAVTDLAAEIDSLAPQLYIQLLCQVELIRDVLSRGILYFVQRDPVSLRRFKWRIDQKNTIKTTYERAFEKITPALLQSISFREPMIFLDGADYSHFKPYEFSEEEFPEYLQEEFGREPRSSVNIGKILRENMAFPESSSDPAVQIADLLAAGIRKCLRAGFANNELAAKFLGRLMVQNLKKEPPLCLVHFTGEEFSADVAAANVVRLMDRASRSMLNAA